MSPRPLLALPILLLALAACGTGAAPSTSPADVTATDVPAMPAPTPTLPAASVAASTPSPGTAEVSTAPAEPEAALLHGARLDLQGKCVPLRTGLPAGATGAIECTPASDVAARASMVVFDTQAQLLDAYRAEVACAGDRAAEQRGPLRAGCRVRGRIRAGRRPPRLRTGGARGMLDRRRGDDALPRDPAAVHPAAGRWSRGRHVSGVERFAWLGNRDQPGNPTLWAEEPLSPEK